MPPVYEIHRYWFCRSEQVLRGEAIDVVSKEGKSRDSYMIEKRVDEESNIVVKECGTSSAKER